jgi:hypothetical protein
MADNYTPRVKAILIENGCTFVRQRQGRSRDLAEPYQQASLHGGQFHQVSALGKLHPQTGRLAKGILT